MGSTPTSDDEHPSFEELADDADLDEYWFEPTTITVKRHTKERLDANRNDQPWDAYLEELRRAHADPLTLSDVNEIARQIKEELRPDITIEVGDVVKFTTPMQGDLYAKRVSEVGGEAIYWRHPDSTNHVLGALEGAVFLDGLIHGPYHMEFVDDPFEEWE